MNADVVVDVGNSRIKWGLCAPDRVRLTASLPPDDPTAWAKQVRKWELPVGLSWILAGVHPQWRDALAGWLHERGETVHILDSHKVLPLEVRLEHPERAGLDRLFNAVAANTTRRPDTAAVLIDAGSAVTVDLIDDRGAFLGGAIFPGLRLMSQSLHNYTALLPLVEVRGTPTALGTETTGAIQAGIFWSVVGGVSQLIRQHWKDHPQGLEVFLTGGDAPLLADELTRQWPLCLWPQMTLEGIRIATHDLL
jgi:type III pantothenate kinase